MDVHWMTHAILALVDLAIRTLVVLAPNASDVTLVMVRVMLVLAPVKAGVLLPCAATATQTHLAPTSTPPLKFPC